MADYQWHNNNSYHGWFNEKNLPPCLKCEGTDFTETEVVPGSHGWASTYKCKNCGAVHEWISGDAMGGSRDSIGLKKGGDNVQS